jgi:hypothetical protein
MYRKINYSFINENTIHKHTFDSRVNLLCNPWHTALAGISVTTKTNVKRPVHWEFCLGERSKEKYRFTHRLFKRKECHAKHGCNDIWCVNNFILSHVTSYRENYNIWKLKSSILSGYESEIAYIYRTMAPNKLRFMAPVCHE